MKYFTNVHTLDELKAEYRRLCMKHHPDRGGDTATMQAINAEHDELFEILKRKHNAEHDEHHQTTETAEEFREIITALLKLDGLTVELCGSWLWIGGDTFNHRAELKALRCLWSSKKRLWYWRHPEDGCRRSRGRSTMDQIRGKYGSQLFTADGDETEYSRIGATA